MDWAKRTYYQAVSTTLSGLAYATGGIHAPWTHKGLDFDDVLAVRKQIQPGDIILTRTYGELTTITIPGYWKHAARYVGDDRVVEAVAPRVQENWLANLIMRTDCYAIMRVPDLPPGVIAHTIELTNQYLGRRYDMGLKIYEDDEVYCSEVIFHSTNKAMAAYLRSDKPYIEQWKRLGYPAFTPDDNYKARKKFELVMEKRT